MTFSKRMIEKFNLPKRLITPNKCSNWPGKSTKLVSSTETSNLKILSLPIIPNNHSNSLTSVLPKKIPKLQVPLNLTSLKV
jgi:hypothetical protein